MKGKTIRVLVVVAVLLFGVSGWAWWHYVRSQSENVFWAMMSNSLQTRSVTHTSVQQSDTQQSTQIGRLQTAPTNLAVGTNKIQQQSTDGTTKVTTQSIGTPFVDFVRYTEISSTTKDSTGKTPDYSSVKGVWGKSAQSDPKQTDGQLYSQAVLGVIPFANLPAAQRNQLIDEMKKEGTYTFDASKVKKEIKDKRPTYTYEVTIKPVAYVKALKSLAGMIGLTQLEAVNPNDYQSTPPATFQLVVDVWSQQVTVVAQPESGSIDTFGSYGLTSIDTTLPTQTTTIDDLQNRLQPQESTQTQ